MGFVEIGSLRSKLLNRSQDKTVVQDHRSLVAQWYLVVLFMAWASYFKSSQEQKGHRY